MKKRSQKVSLINFGAGLLISAMLGGCTVSSDTVKMDNVQRAATAPDHVMPFTSPPVKPYMVIARIQVGPDALVSDYGGQTEEVIKLASELGADGVILEYGSTVSGYMTNSAIGIAGYTEESKLTIGQAFVWLRN